MKHFTTTLRTASYRLHALISKSQTLLAAVAASLTASATNPIASATNPIMMTAYTQQQASSASASDEQADASLLLHYDFSSVSGNSVADASPSGVTATLAGGAKVAELGKYHILDLGTQGGYLDMTSKAGDIFKKSRNFTVSVCYFIDAATDITGNGNFVWTFSQNAANTSSAGPYSAYRVNAQRMATSTGGYSKETGMEAGSASDKGKWVHVAYTEASGAGKLYIDGKLAASKTGMPDVTSIFPSTIACCWLGRPAFSADAYLLNTKLADFRYYNRALAESEVVALSKETASLEDAMTYGDGDATALENAIASAEKLIADSASYFLAGCVEDLKDQIQTATIVAQGGYSQYYIDGIVDNIASAVSTMRQSRGVEFKPYDNVVGSYDTDRGFIHPGGLHTQADFDRIRRQLAESNETVTKAYEVLKNAEYAQPDVATYPVQTIIRGGSSGQNYINAARGATMAYQNALRWKIEGNEDCAKAAVRIIMSWVSGCSGIGGDSNYALAAGLYGYEFAQAAELVRDKFTDSQMRQARRWFLDVWYPSAMGFLRRRNGTWENSANKPGAGWGDAGNRPGHYWSNWGLCNTLCIMSIGVFCDDVTVYNEGLSFFKYDQVGSYTDPRTATPILNDGLTEFLGNLVVTTAATPDTLEASGYGTMGQMQESGRDVGHATMALGLAADIAHLGWNQGDDLFSYMDNRLAAGAEFTAAINCGMGLLPWKDYKYVDCRTAWHNGWYMSGPALGSQVRPYWATIVGHYEGVKGKRMPYSAKNLEMMGIDGGGTGSTSGGYDHLGYSVLMNTRDQQLAPADSVPALLTPLMEYDGQQIAHNELGALKNTYAIDNDTALPKGKTVRLMPQLPDGESDTGLWQWNTGETTKDITITTGKSYVYRATYTNAHGVKSQQCFSIAVQGDCDTPGTMLVSASQDGKGLGSNNVTVFYGSTLTLSADGPGGWGTYLWDNGTTGSTRTTGPLVRERDFEVNFKNHGGAVVTGKLHVNIQYMRVQSVVNGVTKPDTTSLRLEPGDNVEIGPYVPAQYKDYTCRWSNGSTERTLAFDSITTSGTYILDYELGGERGQIAYELVVTGEANADVAPGTYYIRDRFSDTYLTRFDDPHQNIKFRAAAGTQPDASQTWLLLRSESAPQYKLQSAKDSMVVNTGTYLRPAEKVTRFNFYFAKAAGADYYQIHDASSKYYEIDEETGVFAIGSPASLVATNYPLELIPAGGTSGIGSATSPNMSQTLGNTGRAGATVVSEEYYTPGGILINPAEGNKRNGVVIVYQRLSDGSVMTVKRVGCLGKVY